MRKIKNFIHLLEAYFWAWKCGWPGKKLYVIGVTGTDGKTTTCTLIYEILKNAGYRVGLFSTVNVQYSISNVQEKVIAKGLHTTNPGPADLQPILKEMLGAGVTHVVMEVTSHGLDQNRVAGVDFQIGVLTNITHEHLDYHGNMQNYRAAKLKLFRNTKYAILNGDDENFAYFKSQIPSSKPQTIIKYQKTKIKNINPSLTGDYNKYNIAAATEVAKILKIDQRLSDEVIKRFKGVKGRREEVKNKKGFKVFVDFAHTPNALEQILKALQAEQALHARRGKIICVFGCTGERDREKRPVMGKVAVHYADVVIITSDDTRSENQDDIARQIMNGIHKSQIPNHKKIFKINDRREALKKALGMAKKGDVVLLAGKGHEKSILLGKTEIPWNDVEEASKILGEK